MTSALAACGGSHQRLTVISSAQPPVPSSVRPMTLPTSPQGWTTCTVYDGYATQIIFDSRSLNVRAECEVWAANRPTTGYLWGYEHALAIPDALQLCSLSDPRQSLTAVVIEETGYVPVSAAERAKGKSTCASILASGWTARHGTRQTASATDVGRIRRRGTQR
jgi:hypothetical protein